LLKKLKSDLYGSANTVHLKIKLHKQYVRFVTMEPAVTAILVKLKSENRKKLKNFNKNKKK